MKIILGLFLTFALAVNSFGSPLVFKATKELATNDVTELASFDTSKYRQIRIGIKAINRTDVVSKEIAEILFNAAKRENENSYLAIYSQADRDVAKKKLDEAKSNLDISVRNPQAIGVSAVEDSNEILILDFEHLLKQSVIIDSPPTKISIKGYGKGTYKIFVWGTQ